MAARWRRKDGCLNAGNSDFLAGKIHNELVLSRGNVEDVERDTEACIDHSILAIFEDSTVASENKNVVDEESETLLSALPEILDSVDNDDETLSPFDTLPDTKLLSCSEHRDNSVIMSFVDKPRPKSANVTVTIQSDGEKEDEERTELNRLSQLVKQQSETSFHSENKKTENEVEVFTSASLVNLVKLMHSYCLKLHVEEGDKLMKTPMLFSQGEVWKYEKPSEENDEEIDVVSDKEVPVRETKQEGQGAPMRDDCKLLKSVLLNRSVSRVPPLRQKKRVSFGPIQVASLDESVEKRLNEINLTSGHTCETVSVPPNSSKALENPSWPALEAQTASSEMNCNKFEVLPPKAETKAKSLSLQEYRQLRQRKQPPVEKPGNSTTKWPSVSEPPKELPPILCLQGQRQNSCRPKAAYSHPGCSRISTEHLCKPGYKTSSHHTSPPLRPHPSEAVPPTRLRHSTLKHPKTERRTISPTSPLPDLKADSSVTVPRSNKSPMKKPALGSDPPNPVLLPLPVSQTAAPSTDCSKSETRVGFLNRDTILQSTRHLQEIHGEFSIAPPPQQPSSSQPKPQALLQNQDSTTVLQEVKNRFTDIPTHISRSQALCPPTAQMESTSECKKLQPQKCSQMPKEETKLEPKTSQTLSPNPVRHIQCPSATPFSAPPPSPIDTVIPERGTLPDVPSKISPPVEPPATLQLGSRVQNAAGESGIEAPDLTSLLEQFEETQAKEERVCENELEPRLISAAPPSDLLTQKDLGLHRTQEAGTEKTPRLTLTPSVEALEPLSVSETPETPKPLRNLTDVKVLEHMDVPEPLGTEVILSTHQRRKNPLSKAVQIIEPRPLPSKRTLASPSDLLAAHIPSHVHSSVSSDHDYCGPVDHSLTSATQRSRTKASLPNDIYKNTSELQVTTQDASAAAECKKTLASTGQAESLLQHHSEKTRARSETEPSPDNCLQPSDSTATGDGGASEDKTGPCTLPTPPPSPPSRGREKRRYRRRSPRSDSSCSSQSSSSSCSSLSSTSRSPKRQKIYHKRSESSSCSPCSSRSMSCSPPRHYRLSYSRCSRSRSRSWSSSRSRSPSPRICRRRWRDVYSSRKSRREHEIRTQKLKAINERRVVYVGRIRRSMTHSELRERFSQFGEVECVSLHFRDRGDHYGFVTFYNMEDAFAAIDNGGKLRKPDELPFDICFGGRRQFCNSNYSDLDANRDPNLSPAKSRFEDLDFDVLLKQAQRGVKR